MLHGSVQGDPGSYYERQVRGRQMQRLRALPERPLGIMVRRAALQAQTQSLAAEPATMNVRKQQLADLGSGSGSVISAIKAGGQVHMCMYMYIHICT